MAITLLWDQVDFIEDVALVHKIYNQSGKPYIQRKSYRTPRAATEQFFSYSDMMIVVGYTIKNHVDKPWYFDVCTGDHVIESVEIVWPMTDWTSEIKLLERKK